MEEVTYSNLEVTIDFVLNLWVKRRNLQIKLNILGIVIEERHLKDSLMLIDKVFSFWTRE